LIDEIDRIGLPRTLHVAEEWRSFALPRHVPLGSVVPFVDAIGLAATLLTLGHLGLADALFGVMAFAALRAAGSQRARINPRLSEDLAGLAGRIAVPLLFVAPFVASEHDLAWIVRVAPFAFAMVAVGRIVTYKAMREARARGMIVEPTLIVGAGTLGAQVATTLQEHTEFGLHPIGFLDSFSDDNLPLPILGDVRELEGVILDYGVQRVIVAFGGAREPEMVKVIRACDRLPVEVHVVPRFFELGVGPTAGPWVDDLWGVPLVRLRRSALRSTAWRTKRVFDIVASSLLLALASPVMAACAAAVKLSSPGPVFFRQKRLGQRGQVFEMLKFRSLSQNDDSETTWSVTDDDRQTWVGRIMRRTSLDELPQLINVLTGEMSLVGPRPERPFFVDKFRVAVPEYDDRHRVPAGLTGWAQVHGLRGDTSIPERARFDNHYVENWSLWKDVVILFRTVTAVIGGEGG
jgi:exopolysaccharide biosynthesis polyprenyl glycosylphosphotransferase